VANFQGVDIPIVDNRTASTTVLIKSRNTLAIGGLMRQDSSDSHTKVPILGDLPGIRRDVSQQEPQQNQTGSVDLRHPTIVNPEAQTGLEKNYGGMPPEELYVNDKWMPHDNAKPNAKNLKELVTVQKGLRPRTLARTDSGRRIRKTSNRNGWGVCKREGCR